MKLFRYEGYKVTISEEAMMLKPFRVIWERDKTKTKQTALLELGYIYFMCDPRSDYMEISDKDDRSKAIIEAEGMDNWKADRTVTDAMSFYEGFKSTSALVLEDTRVAVDKLRQSLRDFDMTATDSSGRPIYTQKDVIAAIKQVPDLIKSLLETERIMNSDMAQAGRMRGSGEKTVFEDDLQ